MRTSENTISDALASLHLKLSLSLFCASLRLSSLFSFTKKLYNRQKILLLRGACSPRRCDTWERVLVVRPRFSRPAGHQEVPQDWTGATIEFQFQWFQWLYFDHDHTHNVGWHERLAGVQGRRQGLLNCNHLLHDGEHSYHHIMSTAQEGGVGGPHFKVNISKEIVPNVWLMTHDFTPPLISL